MKLALIADGKRVCRIDVTDFSPELFARAERLGRREDKEHGITIEYRHVGNEYRIYINKMAEKTC